MKKANKKKNVKNLINSSLDLNAEQKTGHKLKPIGTIGRKDENTLFNEANLVPDLMASEDDFFTEIEKNSIDVERLGQRINFFDKTLIDPVIPVLKDFIAGLANSGKFKEVQKVAEFAQYVESLREKSDTTLL